MSSLSTVLQLNLIPLQKAVLCTNCEVVSESRNGHCVACGSPSLLCLARVLGDGKNPRAQRLFAHRTPENRRTVRDSGGLREPSRLIRSIPPRLFGLAKQSRGK